MMDQFQQRIIDRSLSDALDQVAFACCHVRCSFPSRHFFTFENLSCLYDDASPNDTWPKPLSRVAFAWLSFSIPRTVSLPRLKRVGENQFELILIDVR